MYQSLINAEFAVLDFLDCIRFGWLDNIMVFITTLGNKGILWIALGLVMLIFKKTRKTGVCVLLALLINLLIVNVTIKPLVSRVRPYELNSAAELIIGAPRDYSFPSGHTSASFACAVSVFFENKKWGMWLIILAVLIGFSRLYLYVHFPTDVLFGAFFGIMCAYMSKFAVSKVSVLR